MKPRLGTSIAIVVISTILPFAVAAQTIEGYGFSLRDVGRYCEVFKYDESYGEVECSRRNLRPVQRACEVYFYDREYGELDCSGRDFRLLERRCTVYMYSEEYGEISC